MHCNVTLLMSMNRGRQNRFYLAKGANAHYIIRLTQLNDFIFSSQLIARCFELHFLGSTRFIAKCTNFHLNIFEHIIHYVSIGHICLLHGRN